MSPRSCDIELESARGPETANRRRAECAHCASGSVSAFSRDDLRELVRRLVAPSSQSSFARKSSRAALLLPPPIKSTPLTAAVYVERRLVLDQLAQLDA